MIVTLALAAGAAVGTMLIGGCLGDWKETGPGPATGVLMGLGVFLLLACGLPLVGRIA